MTSARVRALNASALGCAVAMIAAGCIGLGPDSESFARPPAQMFPAADCTDADIVNPLSDNGMGRFGGGAAPIAVGAGSVPSDFSTNTVVRCERTVDGAGNVVIDAVSLGGDVAELVQALDRPSEREVGNSISDCAFSEDAPVGLWLVSSDGSAVRPHWPTGVCGYQDEPLSAMNALEEMNRVTVATLGSTSVPGSCGKSSGYVFNPTSDADAGGSIAPDMNAFRLMVPTGDVSDLTVCRFETIGGDNTLVNARTLSSAVSQEMATRALDAPVAEPCGQVATAVVAGRLVRPDGSGGGIFTAEVDGCARFMVPGVTGYKQLPNDVRTIFAE